MNKSMRSFGHWRPSGESQEGTPVFKPSPVKVRTQGRLPAIYLVDRDKRLILTAHVGDIIGLRPEHTRRELFISAFDLYMQLVRFKAFQAERVKKAQRLERRRKRRLAP